MGRSLAEADVPLDYRAENQILEMVLKFSYNLGVDAGAAVEHRDDKAFYCKGGVHSGTVLFAALDDTDGLEQLSEPFEGEEFGLDRNHHGVGSGKAVYRYETQRRGAVYYDEIVIVADGLEGLSQDGLALGDIQHLDLGSHEVDMGRNHMEILEFGLDKGVFSRNPADYHFVERTAVFVIRREVEPRGRVGLGVGVNHENLLLEYGEGCGEVDCCRCFSDTAFLIGYCYYLSHFYTLKRNHANLRIISYICEMNSLKTTWFFIVNPHAGSGKTMCQWVPAEQKLEKLGIPFKTAYTDHKRHATELAKIAARQGYRRICAVGGDGSVHEALNGIVKWCDETGTDTSEFILAVMPIGSGNDWIKGTGVPHDTDEVVNLILSESFSEMDVIRMQSVAGKVTYMANIGGVGFDSHVCKRVNIQKERGMRGKMIYFQALFHTIRHLGAINLGIIADGEQKFSGAVYSVALGNGPYSGGGMRQVPDADMRDGLLDVTIIPKEKMSKLLPEIPKLFNGKLAESDKVISFQCRELQVVPLDSSSNDIIESDGEIEGRLPLSVSVTGRRIGILAGN